jgi:hypothetical protein
MDVFFPFQMTRLICNSTLILQSGPLPNISSKRVYDGEYVDQWMQGDVAMGPSQLKGSKANEWNFFITL